MSTSTIRRYINPDAKEMFIRKNPQLNLTKYDVNSVVKTEALIKDFWDFFQLF